MYKEFNFDKIIMTVEDFNALLSHNRQDVYFVAAMTVIALCNYKEEPDRCYSMMNCLKNPAEPLTVYDKQFLRDRLGGKAYKPYSFFAGSSPENGYRPSKPYRVNITSVNSSFVNENRAVLWLHSSGADSDRQIKLREKRSSHEWYLTEQFLLPDIRQPIVDDSGKVIDPWF